MKIIQTTVKQVLQEKPSGAFIYRIMYDSQIPFYVGISLKNLQARFKTHMAKFSGYKKYPDRPNPVRALIFIEDWKLGQFLQCNDDIYTHWKCGDGLIVDREQYHLSANAGVEDKHTVQISGFMND